VCLRSTRSSVRITPGAPFYCSKMGFLEDAKSLRSPVLGSGGGSHRQPGPRMASEPILIFDTSGINRLTDDPDSPALIAGLRLGFHIRLSFTSVSEIIATTDGERRRVLLTICKKLQSSGDSLDPIHVKTMRIAKPGCRKCSKRNGSSRRRPPNSGIGAPALNVYKAENVGFRRYGLLAA
jgi:hypothetical protein